MNVVIVGCLTMETRNERNYIGQLKFILFVSFYSMFCWGLHIWEVKKGTRMNANELADLLADSNDPDIRRAVAMLRQQQAEIEALKAGKIRAYDNGVEDGRKPNTNLVKELTDEEIGDFEYQIIRACGLSTANSDINPIGLRQIIKAILRKAQEK